MVTLPQLVKVLHVRFERRPYHFLLQGLDVKVRSEERMPEDLIIVVLLSKAFLTVTLKQLNTVTTSSPLTLIIRS